MLGDFSLPHRAASGFSSRPHSCLTAQQRGHVSSVVRDRASYSGLREEGPVDSLCLSWDKKTGGTRTLGLYDAVPRHVAKRTAQE